MEVVHVSRLKFYSDSSVSQESIMWHIVSLEKGVSIQRLLQSVETSDRTLVKARLRGLAKLADTSELNNNFYSDVPTQVTKLLERRSTPRVLTEDVRKLLYV